MPHVQLHGWTNRCTGCPRFKGCHTFGKTIDEALARIKEVIGLCREDSGYSEQINTFVGIH